MARIDIRPFHPADLTGFAVQPVQHDGLPADMDDVAVQLLRLCPEAVSLTAPGGKVVVVGGITAGNPASASALVAADAGPWMTAIVRALRQWFAAQRADAILLAVFPDFCAGHRFARLLGFELTGLRHEVVPGSVNYDIYQWRRP